MLKYTLILSMLVVPFASACGGTEEADHDTMTEKATTLGTAVAALEQAATAHHAKVGGLGDLAAVTTEEAAYVTVTAKHHDEMHDALGEMNKCSRSGAPPATTPMNEATEAIEAALEKHKTNMAGAADIAAAKAEETRHDTEMDGLIAEAKTQHTTLGTTAKEFECPHAAGAAHD